MTAKRRTKLVPESHAVLTRWKLEIASELGIHLGGSTPLGTGDAEFGNELGMYAPDTAQYSSGSMGYLTSRENGSIGGEISKRLIAQAQQSFLLP
ncbi:alpha/beta-type small acid-soluble spore protein [Paenibacillus sanguinis]|uniref:alpha/beta-type small acid-soluble spore protein n=1 Tax=Paenibacillus sanguinis TaxID=225906 RepID=UPI00036913DC|nr:alpha/beta-type small acid-soluble spore protein [Paenibacillus sanguinis]